MPTGRDVVTILGAKKHPLCLICLAWKPGCIWHGGSAVWCGQVQPSLCSRVCCRIIFGIFILTCPKEEVRQVSLQVPWYVYAKFRISRSEICPKFQKWNAEHHITTGIGVNIIATLQFFNSQKFYWKFMNQNHYYQMDSAKISSLNSLKSLLLFSN